MKILIAVLALLLASASLPGACCAAQAPDFKISKLFNAPEPSLKSLKALKGKVVFLDFWATWCPACVASLPHVNRLHAALGDSVVFIAITDEPAEKISAFMKTHEMKTWVGIDREKYSLDAYRINARPDGYLIGADGTLLARVSPESLDEKILRDAVAGKYTPQAVNWPEAEAVEPAPVVGQGILGITIAAASGKPQMSFSSDGSLDFRSLAFATNIAYIWDVDVRQVLTDTKPVDSFNFDFKARQGGIALHRAAAEAAVESAFGIRVVPEQREAEVYVLALSTAAGAPRPKPGAPDAHLGLMSYGGGRLLGTEDMRHIARGIWFSLDKPVVDETGLKGPYEFDLQWTAGDTASAARILAGQGLTLTPGRRTMELLHVVPAKP